MKHLKLWLYLSAFLVVIGLVYFLISSLNHSSIVEEYAVERKPEQSGAGKQMQMLFQARAFPDPYYLNDKYERAWKQAEAIRDRQSMARVTSVISSQWMSIGPSKVIGGRILSIAIDPNNINNLFIGSASGGIWKSTDAAASWTYVPTGMPVVGVSSIVYQPNNSNVLLAGTGEVYRTGTGEANGSNGVGNIGFNVWKARGTYGIGILRSSNGGITWTQVFNKKTSDLFAIQMLKFHPTDPNIVYACATDGLYRSIDGGITWPKTPVIAKNYVTDIAISPSDPKQMVIAVGNMTDTDKGIYRSIDGGANWVKLKTTDGLPNTFSGYIRFDNVGNNLFASIGGTTNELYMCTTGATDFGKTWIAKSSSAHCGGQYWFGHDLAVNPSDPRIIIMGGGPNSTNYSYFKYTSSSSSTNEGSKANLSRSIHADVHDIKFANGSIVYIANDGGIYKSTNGGSTWTNNNVGLAATQFYASIAPSPIDAKVIIGGLQDNGVIKYDGTNWTEVVGGDGGPCAFHPTNGEIAIYSNDARAVYYSTNAGGSETQPLKNLGYGYSTAYDERTSFMSPLAISKSNPDFAYVASDNLHISTTGGSSFLRADPTGMTRPIELTSKTAIALAVSPTNHKKVYVSTSPFAQAADNSLIITGNPNILLSTNADDNSKYVFNSIKSNLPDRFVMDFAIDPTNDNNVIVALGGFGSSHIYETTDGGASWKDIGVGLPDVPFNAVLIDPKNPRVLYAGSDLGVYVSLNRGDKWYDYNNGFSDNTALVMDIQATADDRLVIATHGKGAFIGPRVPSTLPVRFISFSGVAEQSENKLLWSTSSESELSHYEVERSTDGANFKKIAEVKAKNVTQETTYNYSDINVSNSFYYRIRSVDRDGKYQFTDIIYLKRAEQGKMSVIGNPFSTEVRLQFQLTQAGQANLSLYDYKGALISRERIKVAAGQTNHVIRGLGSLPAGMYQVEAIINNQRWVEKLVKK